VVFSFDGDQARASYVDPADGRVLGAWQPSALPRWVKNLHRSLLLGDAGRLGCRRHCAGHGGAVRLGPGAAAAPHGRLAALAARVRGSLAQRIHVVTGRVVLAVLCLTSLTALTMGLGSRNGSGARIRSSGKRPFSRDF
jgi:sulfite reductase (NADPH) flavoprotein alpha-component